MLCYAMLCYAMLCYAILYYTILYFNMNGDGFDERDPLKSETKDINDDDADWGQPEQPGPSGESYPITTMNRPPEQQEQHTAEASFIEGPVKHRKMLTANIIAMREIEENSPT